MLGWVQMITVSDNRRSRIGARPSHGELKHAPGVGWRMCVEWFVAMGDPMSHEFSLQMPHFLRSQTGWVRVVFTQVVKVTMTSMSGQSL